MSLDSLISQMQEKLKFAPPLNARILVSLEDEQFIYLDGRQAPPAIEVVDSDEGESETTIILSEENLEKLINGTLDPTMSFMMGKLKVKGKMGYALKLSSLLED